MGAKTVGARPHPILGSGLRKGRAARLPSFRAARDILPALGHPAGAAIRALAQLGKGVITLWPQ